MKLKRKRHPIDRPVIWDEVEVASWEEARADLEEVFNKDDNVFMAEQIDYANGAMAMTLKDKYRRVIIMIKTMEVPNEDV